MDSFTKTYGFTVIIFLGSGNLGSHLNFFYHGKIMQVFFTTINIALGMNHITPMFFALWKSYTFVKSVFSSHCYYSPNNEA